MFDIIDVLILCFCVYINFEKIVFLYERFWKYCFVFFDIFVVILDMYYRLFDLLFCFLYWNVSMWIIWFFLNFIWKEKDY